MLRTLLGGARRPELVELDDAELVALVGREVGPLLGLSGAPLHVSIQRWLATLPRYDLAHPARLAAIERATLPGLADAAPSGGRPPSSDPIAVCPPSNSSR